MNSHTTKKVTLALGVGFAATSMGAVAVKAGPALQTLNNSTNTSEFSINNTYGQSFSVDGLMTATLTPFAIYTAAGYLQSFTAATGTLTTGFTAPNQEAGFYAITTVRASVQAPVVGGGVAALGVFGLDTAIQAVSVRGTTAVTTIGASVASTVFGPSNIKASNSFTNQLINDLSAF